MSLFLSLIILFIISTYKVVIDVNTSFAEAIFLSTIIIAYYMMGKIYSNEWKKINPTSNYRLIFSFAFLPALTIFIFSDYVSLSSNTGLHNILLLFLFVSLMDLDGTIDSYIRNNFSEINDANKKFCYLDYPPKQRVDILPMDVIFYTVSIFIIVKKLT